ncbi:MAG TPA: ribosomal protein S18-alanine N-acetyltransferase [Nevskiaceae bacterium]|nr:ribosomal protein S18-alanine N-acetyltransferase [Nevskiaceae bacterium]
MSAVPEALWRLAPMHEMHLAQVMDIENRAYAFPWTEGIFRDCLKAGYSAWVVTDRGGAMLAYALMTMAVGECHILNVAVDPTRRRQGLARFLLAHLLHVARAGHNTVALLEVRRSNKAALKLYQAFGFRTIGTRRNYYPGHEQREDAFVLALDL